ncbi:MAG: VanZ family protein [Planctomycetes bacterium]|nr:VanZ family protein [Planctomycetota bacterium]
MSPEAPAPRPGFAQALFVAAVAVLLQLSLWPWHFEWEAAELLRRLDEGRDGRGERWLPHALLFLTIGATLARVRPGDGARAGARLVALALLVECAQVFARGRHARVSDLVLHLLAGVVGIALATRWPFTVRLTPQRAIGATLAAALLLLALVAAGFSGTSLDGFDPRFPLVVGAEPDGTRRFDGVIDEVWLSERALSDDELTAGERPADALLPVASAAPCASLAAWRARGAFGVGLRVRPSRPSSAAPATRVTCGEGPNRRNWTLARRGDDLVLHVRCARSGWNASRQPLVWRSVFTGDRAQSLVVAWADGHARLAQDGRLVGAPIDLLLAARADTPASAFPPGLLGLLAILPLACFARALPARRGLAFAVACAPALGLELVLAQQAGVPARAVDFGLGLSLGVLVLRARRSRARQA